MLWLSRWTGCVCLAAAASAAQAQNTTDELFELSLEELLQVRISSASRNEESLREAPAALTVFTRREIQNMGLTELGQLLNLVPGLQAMFEPTQGRDNLLVGRATPESYGQSFLLLIDGQRMNEHYTGGFTLANRFIPLANIERVEIVRGPGSSLYGSSAFSGVIQLFTSRERNDFTLEVGEYQSRRVALNSGVGGQNWHLQSFVQGYQDDGYVYRGLHDPFGLQTRTRDPLRTNDVYLNLTAGATQVILRHTEHQHEDFYQLRRLSDGINYDRNRQTYLRVQHAMQWGDHLDATFAASSNRLWWEPFARLGVGDAGEADFLQGVRLDYRGSDVSADFVYRFSDDQRLNFGLLLEQADIPKAAPFGNYDAVTGEFLGAVIEQDDSLHRVVEDRPRHSHGAYAQWQKQWNPRLVTVLGLRYDHFNDIGGNLSPRLAVNFEAGPNDMLKFLYGQGFRSPGLGDLYDRDAGLTIGNPNLGPIEVETSEFIWQHSAARWTTGVTLFESRASGLLASVPLPDNQSLVVNVGSNDSQGYELELSWQLLDNLLLKGHYTRILHNRTEGIPTGALIAEDLAPRHYAGVIANYQLGRWNFNLNAYHRDQIPILEDDSHWITNLAIGWRLNASVSMQLKALNAFDAQAFAVARGGGLGRGASGRRIREVPLRGRQTQLSLVWQW